MENPKNQKRRKNLDPSQIKKIPNDDWKKNCSLYDKNTRDPIIINEVNKIFRIYDDDKGNTLGLDEFSVFFNKMIPPGSNLMNDHETKFMFDMIDVDRSGQISKSEMVKFIKDSLDEDE